MVKLKISIHPLFFFAFFLAVTFIFTSSGFASSAKQKYLMADNCYKKLRNSSYRQKKASEWLNCISRYEIIYRLHPESSWAPAGMYKAAQLYISLAKKSGKKTYKSQAADLLTRLKNKYPGSAYASRSNSLLKSIKVSPSLYAKKNKHLQSKKKLTKNNKLIRKFKKKENASRVELQKPLEAKPAASKATASKDTLITDLRFWSNPEYTRIVVNADSERDYSHRLLKKDPDIDKPFERLYIDVENTRLGKGVAEHTQINDNLLKQARAGQYLPPTRHPPHKPSQ